MAVRRERPETGRVISSSAATYVSGGFGGALLVRDVSGDAVADALGFDVGQFVYEFLVVLEVRPERVGILLHEMVRRFLDVGRFDGHRCSHVAEWFPKMIRLDSSAWRIDRFLPRERQVLAMTDLLYLPDEDGTTRFTATVTEATDDYVILDGTYFYPEGGGQPADRGTLVWDDGRADIGDVRKDHGDVRHVVESMDGDPPAEGTTVDARIDEQRRDTLRRMHTAQHVVSRVVLDEYGARTAGNQIHPDRARIDFEPADFDEDDIRLIERRSNEALDEDLSVTKASRPRDEVEREVDEGRALLDLIPDSVDPLRVVEIEEFDMCPCGGTHVDSLGEVGSIDIVDRTSKGEDVERIEFVLDA